MAHYHFIGIGGAGLSAIARVLIESSHQVSGSDLVLSPMAEELKEMGVKVSIGHDADHVMGADVIIRSSAIPDSNVEVLAGLNAHIPVIKRVDFLNQLTAGKKVIAFAGTHGKTTSTAMCAWAFTELGLDPSYVIGGVSKNFGSNGHAGKGDYFIIEADEYDRMFMGLEPDVLVVTALEHDHPDCYPTESEYFQAFLDLTRLIKPAGTLITCRDDPGARKLKTKAEGDFTKITYGKSESLDYLIKDVNHTSGCGVSFTLVLPNNGSGRKTSEDITLPVPGHHNALNATAVLAVVDQMGLSVQNAKFALEHYKGTSRRFDILGTAGGITVIDDYAHHPTEIRATLSAARCIYPDRKIWTVWQPHTFSRTQKLIQDFKDAFKDSNQVIVTEIYASREKKQFYSSKEVVRLMDHPDTRQIAELDCVRDFLIENMQPGDVLLVLSAGDADRISHEVLSILRGKEKVEK